MYNELSRDLTQLLKGGPLVISKDHWGKRPDNWITFKRGKYHRHYFEQEIPERTGRYGVLIALHHNEMHYSGEEREWLDRQLATAPTTWIPSAEEKEAEIRWLKWAIEETQIIARRTIELST